LAYLRPLEFGVTARIRWWIAAAMLALVVLVACNSSGDDQERTAAAEDLRPIEARLVELGGPVYAANCAVCHGARGEGTPNWQTRGADGALPPPPHDSTGHTWHHGDGLLFRIVRDGCATYQVGPEPCGMPAFGADLSDEEVRAVIEFMRTWWGPEERAFQEEVTLNDPFPQQR
jgi:mono/diheme cytochrome c family protein